VRFHDIHIYVSRNRDAAFKESEHPRGKEGTSKGGQFVSKGEQGTPVIKKPQLPKKISQEQTRTAKSIKSENAVTFYHGTLRSFLSSIKVNGLLLNPPERVWKGEETSGPGRKAVYLTDDLTTAINWCRSAMEDKGVSEGAVLEVSLPKEKADKLRKDLVAKGQNYLFDEDIPPKYIKSVRTVKEESEEVFRQQLAEYDQKKVTFLQKSGKNGMLVSALR